MNRFGVEVSVISNLNGIFYKNTQSANEELYDELKSDKRFGGRFIPFAVINPIYAGWSNEFFPPENSVTIHHPNGDVKKISVDNDPAVVTSYSDFDDNAFWNILQWDIGTTEAGSSGAPLFDQDHRVIGILSGGDASCGHSVNDYFLHVNQE